MVFVFFCIFATSHVKFKIGGTTPVRLFAFGLV
jgi:hypothetical protein